MAHYHYREHRSSNTGQASRGHDVPSEAIDLHVYPRPVCRDCHNFAEQMLCTKGLLFNFYFDGTRDRP